MKRYLINKYVQSLNIYDPGDWLRARILVRNIPESRSALNDRGFDNARLNVEPTDEQVRRI